MEAKMLAYLIQLKKRYLLSDEDFEMFIFKIEEEILKRPEIYNEE